MSRAGERAGAWIYRGLWAVLVRAFRVPAEPPTLPVRPGERPEIFRPASGYLSYLKFWFWLGLVAPDLGIVAGWAAIGFFSLWLGAVLAVPALLLAVVPDVIAYVAIHLRYDTTWYVMTARSLRIRTGVWVVRETTITFENVQNVRIRQGPVQRRFGIADVIVETAGGGGGGAEGKKGSAGHGHRGVLVGIADPRGLRDLVLVRMRASRGAGLGDEAVPAVATGLTADHIAVLREIRDELASFAPSS